MAKNGAKIILLFHFQPYLFYTIFEGFLEKVFVFIERKRKTKSEREAIRSKRI